MERATVKASADFSTSSPAELNIVSLSVDHQRRLVAISSPRSSEMLSTLSVSVSIRLFF